MVDGSADSASRGLGSQPVSFGGKGVWAKADSTRGFPPFFAASALGALEEAGYTGGSHLHPIQLTPSCGGEFHSPLV